MTSDPPTSPTRPQQLVSVSISSSLSPGSHLGLSVWLIPLGLLWLFVVYADCSTTGEEDVRDSGIDLTLLKHAISRLEAEFENVTRNNSRRGRGGGHVNTMSLSPAEELRSQNIPEALVEKSGEGAGIIEPWPTKRFRRRNGRKRQLSAPFLQAEPWTRDTTHSESQTESCETWRPTLTVTLEHRSLVVDICDSPGPQPRELTTCVRELSTDRDQCTFLFSPKCQLPFLNLSVGAYKILMKPYCTDCFEAVYLGQICDTTVFKSERTYQIVDPVQATRVIPASYIAKVASIGVGALILIEIIITLICLRSAKSCKTLPWCVDSSSPPDLDQYEMGNSFLSPNIQTDEDCPRPTLNVSTAESSFTQSVELVKLPSQAVGSQHNFKSRESQDSECFVPSDTHSSFIYEAASQEGIASVTSRSPSIQCIGAQCLAGDRPSSNRAQDTPDKDIIIPDPGIMFKVELPEVIHKIPYKLMEQRQLTPSLRLLCPTFEHNPQALVHPREICSSCVTINSSTSV